MPTVQETVFQRQAKANALTGLILRVIANRDDYNMIYGPGVECIPRGVRVKVFLTQLNHKSPFNISGDIWVRVKEIPHGLQMWMLNTWLYEEEGDN